MSSVRRGTIAADNFVTVSNAFMRDGQLSLKARGLGAWLMSHRDGWKLSVETIAKTVGEKDGVAAVKSALQELEDAGYLTRSQARSASGKLGPMEYVISDVSAGETASRLSASGEDRERMTDPHKKTIPQEDQKKELPDAVAPDDQASEAKEPTINQRANVIAGAHYERLGKMGNVVAFAKIIKQALTAGRLDADVDQACAWIAENHWTLTAERLANVLAGGPKLPGRPAPKPIGNTGAVMTADEAEAWLLERYHAGAAEEVAARTGRTYEAPHPKSVPPGMDPAEFQLADRKQWIKYYRRGLMCVLMGQPFRNGTEVEGV